MPEWAEGLIGILLILIIGPWVMIIAGWLVIKLIMPIHIAIADRICKVMEQWEDRKP